MYEPETEGVTFEFAAGWTKGAPSICGTALDTNTNISSVISELSGANTDPWSPSFAKSLDDSPKFKDVAHTRAKFVLPTVSDISQEGDNQDSCVYLTGNSLGLQPKKAAEKSQEFLKTWATRGTEGHFTPAATAFCSSDNMCVAPFERLVGAKAGVDEVTAMGSLTANLHVLLQRLYRPTETRRKVITDPEPFPSDAYAVQSAIRLRGGDADSQWIQAHGGTTKDFIDAIQTHGETLALVLVSPVHFHSGEVVDIPAVTEAAHAVGVPIILDLAHAIGNIPLHLHDHGVDAAAWCTYKYLNAGPGAVAGIFLHEKHHEGESGLQGWWGNDVSTRFKMLPTYTRGRGAADLRLSCPNAGSLVLVQAGLSTFQDVPLPLLHAKSRVLTSYLWELLETIPGVTIAAPEDPARRGAQLSFETPEDVPGARLNEVLMKNGIVCDVRRGGIRCAPVPLYIRFVDVLHFATVLREAIGSLRS